MDQNTKAPAPYKIQLFTGLELQKTIRERIEFFAAKKDDTSGLLLENFLRYVKCLPSCIYVQLDLSTEHDQVIFEALGMIAPSGWTPTNKQLKKEPELELLVLTILV